MVVARRCGTSRSDWTVGGGGLAGVVGPFEPNKWPTGIWAE